MKANQYFKQKNSLKHDNFAMAAQLGAIIALLVAILVGVLVYYQISKNSFAAFSSDGATKGAAARTAFNNTNTTASTVFTLAPIIGIVAIAGIILYIVTRFGQGGMG